MFTLFDCISSVLFIISIYFRNILCLQFTLKYNLQHVVHFCYFHSFYHLHSIADQLFNTKSNVMMSYRKEKIEISTRCFVLVSIVLTSDILFLFYTYYLGNDYSFAYVSIYSYIVMCLRSIQVIFLVCLLRNRLKLIIEELKDIQNALNGLQSNDISMHDQSTRNELNLSIFDRLLNVKRIYGELFEWCEQLSIAFGWSILINTIEVFMEFTSNFYWGFMCFRDLKDFLLYVFEPEIFLVCTCAYYCSSCAQWVSLLLSKQFVDNCMSFGDMDHFPFQSRLVQVALNRIPIDKQNQAQNDLLREFSLQVHHQQFFISANGYITFDLKLISSVSYFSYFCTNKD